jgi:hypothetical protein
MFTIKAIHVKQSIDAHFTLLIYYRILAIGQISSDLMDIANFGVLI